MYLLFSNFSFMILNKEMYFTTPKPFLFWDDMNWKKYEHDWEAENGYWVIDTTKYGEIPRFYVNNLYGID